MRYTNGTEIRLGDIVFLDVPDGYHQAKVVMLGDTGAHLEIDQEFLEWAQQESLISKSTIVVEWVGDNPFKHNNTKYAPVGNYMFTGIDEYITLIRRGP